MKITNNDSVSKSSELISGNIKYLKQFFPNVVNGNIIDFEALKIELGGDVSDKNERFGFTWPDKDKCKQLALKPSTATLRPVFDTESDLSNNTYIEGDNLEVLKVLQRSYHKRIDLIYIDPPYNTGKDFIYPDNFKDNVKNYLQITGQLDSEGKSTSSQSEKSGRYHTNWLNMMYPRLKLARNLLSDEGVIFISIDDTEQSNLKSIW